MECFGCLELNDSDGRIVCLWVRIRGRLTKQISWWELVKDHPARMKTDEIFYKQLRGGTQSLHHSTKERNNLESARSVWKRPSWHPDRGGPSQQLLMGRREGLM